MDLGINIKALENLLNKNEHSSEEEDEVNDYETGTRRVFFANISTQFIFNINSRSKT